MPLLLFTSFTASTANITSLDHLANVRKIIQDHHGFIWLAGQHGLIRFDGTKTVHFSSLNKEWPLPFTWIHDISLTGNKLLVATEAHKLWEFDPNTGASQLIDINTEVNSVYDVISFANNYFLNVGNNLYRYDPTSSQTDLLTKDIAIKQLAHTNKHLYISSKTGLYRLVNNHLERVVYESISTMVPVDNGIVAVGANKLHYLGDDGYYHSVAHEDTIHVSAHETGTDNFFIINNLGKVKKFSGRELTELTHNFPNVEPLFARQLLHDSSGVLWIITDAEVKKLAPSMIKNHHRVFNVASNANEIERLNNKLVIGSYGDGIHSFEETDPMIHPRVNDNLTMLAKKTMDLLTIDQRLYVATFDGLWLFDHHLKTFERVDFPNNNQLLLKLFHKNNLLYLATNYAGFYIYDIEQGRLLEHVGVEQGLSSAEITEILTIDNNNIWLATPTGVDIYNRSSQTARNIDIPGSTKVISFAFADNKIFAATKGDGIFVLDRQGDILSHFAMGQNFSTIAVINDEIWAPAQHGLFRINPLTNQFTLVPNTEFYSFSDSPVELNNTLYVPHYGGVLEVPLAPIEQYHPKVTISKTTISGQSYLDNKTINLNNTNDIVTLELASMDYRSGQEKQFKYQINNGSWNDVSNARITFAALASGVYNITIKGTNSLGQWSDYSAFTEINVAFPWYWTPTIRILYLLCLILLTVVVGWLLYLRAKSINHIHQLLAADLKTHGKTALTVSRNLAQANALFDEFLTAGSVNNDLNLQKIKQIISESLDELNSHNKTDEPDNLYGQSLEAAMPYFSEYFHHRYHVHIDCKIELHQQKLSYEMQADLYKIIYEAITSAIYSGNGRSFNIVIQEFRQKIWLTIGDDENSFANFNNKINFDMAIYYIRQIANKYHAVVNTSKNVGKGSQLVIGIPLINFS